MQELILAGCTTIVAFLFGERVVLSESLHCVPTYCYGLSLKAAQRDTFQYSLFWKRTLSAISVKSWLTVWLNIPLKWVETASSLDIFGQSPSVRCYCLAAISSCRLLCFCCQSWLEGWLITSGFFTAVAQTEAWGSLILELWVYFGQIRYHRVV